MKNKSKNKNLILRFLPYYKKLDYENGIRRGAYVLAQTVANAENVTIRQQGACPPKTNSSGSSRRDEYPWWIWPVAIVLSIFSPRRRFNSGSFGGFGGGSFGGGSSFGGFGGGSFGGGGGGGKW